MQVLGFSLTKVRHTSSEEADVEDVGHEDSDGRIDTEDAHLGDSRMMELASVESGKWGLTDGKGVTVPITKERKFVMEVMEMETAASAYV